MLRKTGLRILAPTGLAAALILGAVLRLIWPLDIEYKLDESWTFEQVQDVLAGKPWSWTGMRTSLGFLNPGMSLWVFIPLGLAFGTHSAPEFARAVQLINIAALFGLVAFALLAIPFERREPWLWAAAFWALNPLAIILERKIWPPSVLPLGTVVLIAAWWYRDRFVPAFVWGLIGALMSQVHPGAGFFILAVAFWTALSQPRAVQWAGWLSGSLLGALSALPWALQLAGSETGLHVRRPLLSFYFYWFTQPFGFGSEYTLGPDHMREFLSGPLWMGRPSYLMGLLHVVLALLLLTVALRVLSRLYRSGWPSTRSVFLGDEPGGLLVRASLWGYGAILTLITAAGVGSYRHYLIVAAPLMGLWAAQAVLFSDSAPRRQTAHFLLTAFCMCQAALGGGLLAYIHTTQIIHGEYGPTWRSQQLLCSSIERASHLDCLKFVLGKH